MEVATSGSEVGPVGLEVATSGPGALFTVAELECVESKNTEKDQKINHEPAPTTRTCCPKSWNHEFVVFVRFVVEKIRDKML